MSSNNIRGRGIRGSPRGIRGRGIRGSPRGARGRGIGSPRGARARGRGRGIGSPRGARVRPLPVTKPQLINTPPASISTPPASISTPPKTISTPPPLVRRKLPSPAALNKTGSLDLDGSIPSRLSPVSQSLGSQNFKKSGLSNSQGTPPRRPSPLSNSSPKTIESIPQRKMSNRPKARPATTFGVSGTSTNQFVRNGDTPRPSSPAGLLARRTQKTQIDAKEKEKQEHEKLVKKWNELSRVELSKKERTRLHALDELINTEKQYLEDLKIIQEEFLNVMTASNKIAKTDIDVLFSNVVLLENINKEVLKDLNNRQLGIGDVFQRMSPYLKMYTEYCINQPKALARLETLTKTNKDFYKILEKAMSNPRTKNLQLRAYLIKPVQRVCKYPLLLRELLRNIDPSSSEYKSINEAKKQLDRTVDAINEGKRIKENQMAVVAVQHKIEGLKGLNLVTPTRRLVIEGPLRVTHSLKSSGDSRYVWLFNDLIVVAKASSSKNTRYQYKISIPFPAEARFIVVSDQDRVKNAFEIDWNKKRFIMCCPSKTDQQKWCDSLKAMVKEMQIKKLEEMKKKSSSSSPSSSSSSSPRAASLYL